MKLFKAKTLLYVALGAFIVLGGGFFYFNVARADLDSGLVAHWKLNNSILDETENNNDLTNNGATSATGFYGASNTAYDLELSDSDYLYINNGDQSNLNFTGDFTCTFWAKLEQLPSDATTPMHPICMGQYKRTLKKGVRWYYSGQYLGGKYHSKAIYKSKTECAKAERAKLEKLDEEARNPKQDITLLDLFSHRLDYLKLTRNQEYYRDNRRLSKQVLGAWGNINASEVTKRMVADLIMDEVKRCQKNKLGSSRPNQLLKVLKANFNYANEVLGFEFHNPCLGIQKLPEETKVKFIPSEKMIKEVMAKCNKPQKALVKFVYETASRINEAISLEYNDVQDGHVVLYTRKSRNSNRVPRFVPKPDCIQTGGKGRVFKEWTAYPRFLEDKVQELKQPTWNWHSLRHRRASIWAKEGKPLFELQMLLGHTQISTTQRYLHSLGIVKF